MADIIEIPIVDEEAVEVSEAPAEAPKPKARGRPKGALNKPKVPPKPKPKPRAAPPESEDEPPEPPPRPPDKPLPAQTIYPNSRTPATTRIPFRTLTSQIFCAKTRISTKTRISGKRVAPNHRIRPRTAWLPGPDRPRPGQKPNKRQDPTMLRLMQPGR